MPTRRFSGIAVSASVPDNGGDNSGGGGSGAYADDVFSTYLYAGNGGIQRIENGIDLAGEGGLVWIKGRDDGNHSHCMYDTERGPRLLLTPHYTEEEKLTGSKPDSDFVSFNSDGFTLGENWDTSNMNSPSMTKVVSWTLRKAPKFFDVVTWTGDGVAGREIPHNLGIEPGMIIVKRTDSSSDWTVWHKGATGNAFLQTTDPWQTSDTRITDPDSASFTVSDSTMVNASNGEYVAYLFAHDDFDESLIKCGSFTTPADGTTRAVVELGWEPQWVLTKSSSTTDDWQIIDSIRGITGSQADPALNANSPNAEANVANAALTSTGFEILRSANQDYIYMAIRRPNKPAEEFDPEELFAIGQGDGDSDTPDYISNFPVDAAITKRTSAGNNGRMSSRLTGAKYLSPNLTQAESADGAATFDFMNGWGSDGTNRNTDEYSWMWRRAPGYFDVVAYEGNGQSGREVPHNLGVVPEMIWLKNRTSSGASSNWIVATPTNAPKEGALNNDNSFSPYGNITAFSASTFTLLNGGEDINQSPKNYIAYLFASVPGISKVGSYTGTGEMLVIDCGFSDYAQSTRGLLIKRVDSAGDWAWFCPHESNGTNLAYRLHLNDTSAAVRQNDVGAGFGGFRLQPTAPENILGAEYIYYAIADIT